VNLLTIADVSQCCRMHRSTIDRMIRLKLMPLPIHIGKMRRWRSNDIQEWIAAGCPAPPTVKKSRMGVK
jgi:predicted DNA-binding transcriptional regulator AlpA